MGKIFWIVVLFLVVGGYFIKINYDLNLAIKDDQTTFVKEFGKWIFGVGKNTANVVGYAAKQDWLPENQTNETG